MILIFIPLCSVCIFRMSIYKKKLLNAQKGEIHFHIGCFCVYCFKAFSVLFLFIFIFSMRNYAHNVDCIYWLYNVDNCGFRVVKLFLHDKSWSNKGYNQIIWVNKGKILFAEQFLVYLRWSEICNGFLRFEFFKKYFLNSKYLNKIQKYHNKMSITENFNTQ